MSDFAASGGGPMAHGGWTKPMFGSQEPGLTCTGQSIPPVTLSILCCHQSEICLRPSCSFVWRYRGTGGMRPRVVNVDGHPAYARAIEELKQSGDLGRRCRCRPAPYLNNIIEQDHRFIKKRIAASLWFRSAEGAMRTIAGYEAMHLIRKGQIRWLPKGDVVGQLQF